MHYHHEKNWIELYLEEINVMIHDLQLGNNAPVIDHLKILRTKIKDNNYLQLRKAAESESTRDFAWGQGIKPINYPHPPWIAE